VADGFVAWGDAAQVTARLAEYRAAGVDLPVIFPMPVGSDWGYEQTIAELALSLREALPSARKRNLSSDSSPR
jgi:hypothetical protein